MKNYPSLRQFQYLLALEKTRNFRKAALECNITQPTLSAAIKEMENILGLPVLDRGQHKKLIFTPFGQEVLASAKTLIPTLDTLITKAEQKRQPLSGPFRLGVIPTVAPYYLPNILPKLQKAFPKIEWQITEGMSADLVTKMNDGDLDLAIIAFPYETPDLNQKVFFDEEFICAAPKGVFKSNKKLSLKDLDKKDLLLLQDGHCLRDHALSVCKLQTKQDERALSATSLQTLIQMVAQGYGITLLPKMVVEHGALPKKIDLHAFKRPIPSRKIGVIWRGSAPQISTIQAVIQKI